MWVKVIDKKDGKLSLSMKDVDQFRGTSIESKERKSMKGLLSEGNITGIKADLAGNLKRKRLDSPTMWEISRI